MAIGQDSPSAGLDVNARISHLAEAVERLAAAVEALAGQLPPGPARDSVTSHLIEVRIGVGQARGRH